MNMMNKAQNYVTAQWQKGKDDGVPMFDANYMNNKNVMLQ